MTGAMTGDQMRKISGLWIGFWAGIVLAGVSLGAQVPVIASYLHWNNAASLTTQGGYTEWNYASVGETDFDNVQGSGVGGYRWYNTTAHTLLMLLDQAGNLTVNVIGNVTGNVSGSAGSVPYSGLTGSVPTWNQSTTGNAATATALAAAGSNCGSGGIAYGVDVSGNALCNPSTYKIQSMYITSGLCTTAGSETYCTAPSSGFFNWPAAFSDSTYVVNCNYVGQPTGTGSHPGLYGPYIVGQTAAGIQVELQAGSNSAGGNNSVGGLYCIAQHN